MNEFVPAARLSDLVPGVPRCVVLSGRRIGLVNLEGTIHAFDDTCTHAQASLCEGVMAGGEIVCPLHGATFDVRTGRVTGPPADEDIATYEVRIRGDEVEVKVGGCRACSPGP
jgi:nitrite reductase/ring-hydroxylating ferredoxin subunit